jgi:hypothetical protein
MTLAQILAEIDEEIDKLQQARSLLSEGTSSASGRANKATTVERPISKRKRETSRPRAGSLSPRPSDVAGLGKKASSGQ